MYIYIIYMCVCVCVCAFGWRVNPTCTCVRLASPSGLGRGCEGLYICDMCMYIYIIYIYYIYIYKHILRRFFFFRTTLSCPRCAALRTSRRRSAWRTPQRRSSLPDSSRMRPTKRQQTAYSTHSSHCGHTLIECILNLPCSIRDLSSQ